MKKSYRRAARRRHVYVKLPIEAVRLLYVFYAERHCWKGCYSTFSPSRSTLNRAVLEQLSKGLANSLADLVVNYDNDYVPGWDANRLMDWLADLEGSDWQSAVTWLSQFTKVEQAGFYKDNEGNWITP